MARTPKKLETYPREFFAILEKLEREEKIDINFDSTRQSNSVKFELYFFLKSLIMYGTPEQSSVASSVKISQRGELLTLQRWNKSGEMKAISRALTGLGVKRTVDEEAEEVEERVKSVNSNFLDMLASDPDLQEILNDKGNGRA